MKNKKNLWPALRLLVGLFLLTGLLIVVIGTGAQSVKSDIEAKSPKIGKDSLSTKKIPNFDIRYSGGNLDNLLQKSSLADVNNVIEQSAVANKTSIENGFAELKAQQPDAEIEGSSLTGAVEIVRSPSGLSKPAPGRSGEDIVSEFISANRSLYGLGDVEIANLHFIGESISPDSGLRMVRVEQIANDRPIFQSETRFILDKEGRIIRSLGLMVPNASSLAGDLDNLLSPQDALQRTMDQLGVSLDVNKIQASFSDKDSLKAELIVDDLNVTEKVTSKLVYFSVAPGVLIPAWSQTVFGVDQDWYVLVDARSGDMLWRKNIRSEASTHDARFRVFVQADGITPADNPGPQSPSAAVVGAGTQFPGIAPTIVSMFLAQNIIASPNGWIDDCPGGVCTVAETQTLGNNTLVCVDRTTGASNVCDTTGVSAVDGNGRATGNADVNSRNRDFLGTTTRDFQGSFLPAPQGGNPEAGTGALVGADNNAGKAFLRGSLTQQFYVTNWYHDKLFALGFNPAAGNFQNNNFGGGGSGNDRILVDVQDGQSTNNANFSTPPDGQSGRSQMFIFPGPTIDRDGGLDTEILIHELTHGTSNRLIGNGAGLVWDIGSGMGEGWSDFYALSLLNNTNADNPNGNYASGAYATYKITAGYLDNYVYGIRRFPYSTNNAVNPLTWGDVDQTTYNHAGGIAVSPLGFEIGGAAEVHNSGEIWTLSLWEMRSRIIAANAGDVPTGNQISLQLVTDAMKLTPASPSFIQARDALIDADCATNACANEESIWGGFSDRGLGYGSKAPNRVSFTISAPHIGVSESTALPNIDINTVVVSDPVGNSSGFVDPSEQFRLEINLKNPWRHVSKTASGITATLTSSTPGVTFLNGSTTYPDINPSGNADKNGATFVVKSPAVVCGTRLNFTLSITSSLGTVTRDFSLRMGQPSGTLAPMTYTRSALGLAVQDNRPVGVMDTLNVTDDFEIADVDVRIDSLTHTFPGDLTFSLKGPNGYGTDVLARLGGNVAGSGDGDNVTNMRFDDEATGDVLNATNANAPYTSSWKPIFNSPTWAAIGFPPADTVPQLSNFDGSNTLGAWRVIASDQSAIDAGTLQGWSLIVTPRNFVCSPVAPSAGNVSISGTVVNENGSPLSRAVVKIMDSTGRSWSAISNPFGYFSFSQIPAGYVYTVTVQSKGHTFAAQAISVNDDLDDLILAPQP